MTGSQTAADRSSWMIFAMTMFFVLGAIDIIFGIAMVANSDFVVFSADGAWLVDITAWGWITLLVGVLQVLVGWGLTTGSELARVLGITLAVIAAINAFFVIPIYPIWGILSFAVAVIVIYPLSSSTQTS